ncbi:MAG: hypothetical protein SOW56_02230 [Bacteroidaceae bacterium]|nr:hypothetical protein [Prevotellaceae bacterium]MDY3062831.1 hypothetical protein [Bacteroidaceae bacterium]
MRTTTLPSAFLNLQSASSIVMPSIGFSPSYVFRAGVVLKTALAGAIIFQKADRLTEILHSVKKHEKAKREQTRNLCS